MTEALLSEIVSGIAGAVVATQRELEPSAFVLQQTEVMLAGRLAFARPRSLIVSQVDRVQAALQRGRTLSMVTIEVARHGR